MINVEEKKAKIIDAIKAKGPMLPIQVSREIELSSLFTSAIMSEMLSNKQIVVSNLKVGGSPLYYISGQQGMLEKFTNYLGSKEKEAFMTLKERGVLQDERLDPALRVAIRSIRDFAIPLKVNVDNQEKIFWRFLSVTTEDATKKIREMMSTKRERRTERISEEKDKYKAPEKEKKEIKRESKEGSKPSEEFCKRISEYIKKENIEIVGEMEKKKKEVYAKVNVNSSIGPITMLLIAKDKKTITENDLNLALSKGQGMKMPVLFISNGKMSKKAIAEIETFKSYLIFREIAF